MTKTASDVLDDVFVIYVDLGTKATGSHVEYHFFLLDDVFVIYLGR